MTTGGWWSSQRLWVTFAAALALTGGGMLAAARGTRASAAAGFRAGPGDDRAPEDPRYMAALRLGLSGQPAEARRRLLELARSERGTNTGAWSLYQASLAARVLREPDASDAGLAELRREYPRHPLSARLATAPADHAPPERRASDCGPRSLLHLCERAEIPATLAELTERCGTDEHGTTLDRLQNTARKKGFQAAAARVDAAFLRRHRPSGIAWVNGDHYVAFGPGDRGDKFQVWDANLKLPEAATAQELAKRSQGIVLLLAWGGVALPPM